MELQVYKRTIIIFVVLAIIISNMFSQCLCSEVKFRLILSNLEYRKDVSNYSIKTIAAPDFIKIDTWRNFNKTEIKGDTLNLEFKTGGGIDTLIFIIRDNKTNGKMIITVVNMTYDNPYFIDLTTFSCGDYFFDWQKINKCQEENKTIKFIECEEMKFYQLQMETEKEYTLPFVHNRIRPYTLKFFEKK